MLLYSLMQFYLSMVVERHGMDFEQGLLLLYVQVWVNRIMPKEVLHERVRENYE